MILGLDVGGTQTDAVLIEAGEVAVQTKTATGNDLLETLRCAVEGTLAAAGHAPIGRMAFSTTMATNAIVQDRLEPAGMIVTAGPGMDPRWFAVGPAYHVVGGCLDHRGIEALPLEKAAVTEAARRIREQGIEKLGVVAKFSVRNPAHEHQIAQWIGEGFGHVALGHRVSGALNFPRRIATTYLNAALYGLHRAFTAALLSILDEKGLAGPRYLLKPDGGTLGLESSMENPASTAQSGPAASVMGAIALDGCPGTSLVLDIGGTTTDMAVVIDGVPLLESSGIELGPYRTLIRSLSTCSVGIGGESEIRLEKDGRWGIGPLRQGPPAALGGPGPTPTDAMVLLDKLPLGDKDAARTALEGLAGPLGLRVPKMAETVLERMGEIIADSARAFLHRINSRPVYTIHEVLREERVEPTSVVVIGGPAPQLAPYVSRALGLPCRVPPHSGVANAVGAAVSRVTREITLQADTGRGYVIVPEAGLQKPIDARFGLQEALSLGRAALLEMAAREGLEPGPSGVSVTEQQVFNMVRGFSSAGRNIRVKMGLTPGIIPEWKGPS